MKRDIYSQLLKWKMDADRKPLILKGARQVGKTYILKKFAANEYENCIYINFEKQREIFGFFEGNLAPNEIINKLSIYYEQQIQPDKTLIIFDEIQACSGALISLKYFCEEAHQYHVVAAGSLLGVKLSNDKGFPVGKVNFLNLYPLTFFEFLDATGKWQLRKMLEEIKQSKPIDEPFHNSLVGLLKTYIFVGGMPEVVHAYVTGKPFVDVRNVQKTIIDAYISDFAKHIESIQIMKILDIWNSIPHQLAKENKKFIFSAIRKSARAREYETAIYWLLHAGLIYESYYIETPKIPLKAYCDQKIFKIFMLDVGLLGAMSDLSVKAIVHENKIFSEFKGALAENYVAQELMATGLSSFFYWSTPTAEVDFILQSDTEILPLEVKAGESVKKKKGLKIYNETYNPLLLLRASLKNLKKDDKILNCPLYAIALLKQLFSQFEGAVK